MDIQSYAFSLYHDLTRFMTVSLKDICRIITCIFPPPYCNSSKIIHQTNSGYNGKVNSDSICGSSMTSDLCIDLIELIWQTEIAEYKSSISLHTTLTCVIFHLVNLYIQKHVATVNSLAISTDTRCRRQHRYKTTVLKGSCGIFYPHMVVCAQYQCLKKFPDILHEAFRYF